MGMRFCEATLPRRRAVSPSGAPLCLHQGWKQPGNRHAASASRSQSHPLLASSRSTSRDTSPWRRLMAQRTRRRAAGLASNTFALAHHRRTDRAGPCGRVPAHPCFGRSGLRFRGLPEKGGQQTPFSGHTSGTKNAKAHATTGLCSSHARCRHPRHLRQEPRR